MREIRPLNNNGSIQLKFSVSGKRYSFNPIPGASFTSARDLKTAQAIATRIQNDILASNFDKTLDRYRLTPKAVPTDPHKASEPRPKTLLTLWDSWVASLELSKATQADHYEMVRRMLVRAEPTPLETSWLTQADLAPSTFNKRLGYMKTCLNWAISEGLVGTNPYAKMRGRKAQHRTVKPFTLLEASQVIHGFTDLQPHYSPFVTFLFLTGVRLSEAIGLRWAGVDFDRGVVTISESLSIDRAGNGYRRVFKETKTGSVRYLEMSDSLRAILEPLKRCPDDLVFTSPTGRAIASQNFRARYWKPVLEAVKVPYRNPHVIRHSFASHAIDQGFPVPAVSYLMGHSDTRMVMRTYGHMIDRPQLPQIF